MQAIEKAIPIKTIFLHYAIAWPGVADMTSLTLDIGKQPGLSIVLIPKIASFHLTLNRKGIIKEIYTPISNAKSYIPLEPIKVKE